ncbi:transporter substrate-binding domain-containing protein [Streptomyces anulatus]|uniref:transporter substrate-binding domain-containing protein n=1 Tax=Streptomyces anulatus TaxID=1892 RepID=UPI003404EFF2
MDRKLRRSRRIRTGAAAMTVALVALVGCSSESESIFADKVNVGVKGDQPGTSFLYRDGDFRGFDVTVVKDVLNDVGVEKPLLRGVLSRDRVPALQDGDVEIVASTFSITPNRMKPQSKAGGEGGLDFVGPYASTHQGMLVREGDIGEYKKIKDFNKKIVCVWEGTTSEDLLATPAYEDIKRITAANADECIEGLKDGDFDAVSTDRLILYGFAKEYPELSVVKDLRIGQPNKYGIAMKKGHREDCKELKKVLLKYVRGDRWGRAFDEYLPSEVREESRPTPSEIEQQSCVDKPGGP